MARATWLTFRSPVSSNFHAFSILSVRTYPKTVVWQSSQNPRLSLKSFSPTRRASVINDGGSTNSFSMILITCSSRPDHHRRFVHPRYGSRLMLGGLFTTAALSAMRSPDDARPGCPPDCRICSDACPVGAIMPGKRQVKIMRSLRHTARTPMMSRFKFLYLRAGNAKAAAHYMSITAFDEHTFLVCSKCVSACPYGEARVRDGQ